MKNTNKKGELLVETIVAMTIAALMTIAFFGIFKSFSSVGKRQEEYIFFEGVCYDIDKYYDAYGKDMWDEEYFKKDKHEMKVDNDRSREPGRDPEIVGNFYVEEYMDNYEPLFDEIIPEEGAKYAYILTYYYKNDELIVNIKNNKTGKYVIQDLHYGKSRVTDIGEYYSEVQNKNIGVLDDILRWLKGEQQCWNIRKKEHL